MTPTGDWSRCTIPTATAVQESARRFAEIQEAYEDVRARPRPARPHRTAEAAESIKERMATLERELREAQAARERARRAAREAARDGDSEPAPVTTEDGQCVGPPGRVRRRVNARWGAVQLSPNPPMGDEFTRGGRSLPT
jgi:hypothetical protein